MLTKSQAKALRILKEYDEPIRPREFARRMWPDSECWTHWTKCGNKGVSRGGGMSLAGGGYLGKLMKRGWVYSHYSQIYGLSYALSIAGRAVMREYDEHRITQTKGAK